jgi:hypothetical protein
MEIIHPAYPRHKKAKMVLNKSSEKYKRTIPIKPTANGFKKYNG